MPHQIAGLPDEGASFPAPAATADAPANEPDQLSDLRLAERLTELLTARDRIKAEIGRVELTLQSHRDELDRVEAEAVAVKQHLGATAKGKRKRSHPTTAASSPSGSSHDLLKLLPDRKWRTSAQILALAGATTPDAKARLRNGIRRLYGKGELERRETSKKTNANRPVYEYRRIA